MAHIVGEHRWRTTNTPKGVCSCSFAEHRRTMFVNVRVRQKCSFSYPGDSFCHNMTPSTVPPMYMAQADKLTGTLEEWNMRYSPRSAIPKQIAMTAFMICSPVSRRFRRGNHRARHLNLRCGIGPR
jgi:hypothetical protein